MVVPDLVGADEVGLAQDVEVPRHRGPGQIECRGEFTGGHVSFAEEGEDATSRRVGEGSVDTVDLATP